MSDATGYSLWLTPDICSEAYTKYSSCIASIADRYGTPRFLPHVTLLGGVQGSEKDLYDRAWRLAERLAPYEIALDRIGSNGVYFQILFLEVVQTGPVMQTNVQAQQIFGVTGGVYFPHLSLAYGDFSEEILENLRKELTGMQTPAFVVHRFELWHTEGPVENWCKVDNYPFAH